jgi:hypothetical protein
MAEKFKKDEITKLLNILVGPTTPVGDTAVDEAVDKNMMTLIDIINWCLDGVADAARFRHSEYYSMRHNGERAFSAMVEWKDWLQAVILED